MKLMKSPPGGAWSKFCTIDDVEYSSCCYGSGFVFESWTFWHSESMFPTSHPGNTSSISMTIFRHLLATPPSGLEVPDLVAKFLPRYIQLFLLMTSKKDWWAMRPLIFDIEVANLLMCGRHQLIVQLPQARSQSGDRKAATKTGTRARVLLHEGRKSDPEMQLSWEEMPDKPALIQQERQASCTARSGYNDDHGVSKAQLLACMTLTRPKFKSDFVSWQLTGAMQLFLATSVRSWGG